MRYAIIGAGALGGFYGISLAHAGCDVHWLMRSDFAAAQAHGLHLRSPRGPVHLPTVAAYAQASQLPPCDVVLVCTKTTANAQLAALVQPALRPGGVVVLMQNGLGNEEDAARQLPGAHLLAGLCFLCANRIAPGVVEHLDYGDVAFGLVGERPPQLDAMLADFARAGIATEVIAHVAAARWRKLCWNVPFNGLCALLDTDTARVMADPATRSLAGALMDEVAAAAAASGHPLPDGFRDKMLRNTERMRPYLPSMVFDLRLGREPELEYIYERPLAAGRAHGVAMPRTEALAALLRFHASA